MYSNQLSFFSRKKKCQQGGGILQVLSAMAFMFLLVYAMIEMLTNAKLAQRKQQLLTTLRDMQAKVTFILNDPDSWRNTMQDAGNTTMACLQGSLACAAGAQRIVVLRDANNVAVLNNLPAWTTASIASAGGFSETGESCSTFSTTAPSANCPFSYKMVWEPVAAGIDPGFRITARLIYSAPANYIANTAISLGIMTNTPGTDLTNVTTADPTKKAVQVVGNAANEVVDANMGKYDVVVWRSATTNVLSFRATTTTSGATGACSTVGFAARTLAEAYDPFNLITIGGPNVQLKYIATYECDVSAAGNSVLSFQVRLQRTGGGPPTTVGSGAGYASTGTQSMAEFNTAFVPVIVNQNVQVEQQCEAPGGADGLGLNFPANSAVVASLNCRVTN